MNGCPKSKIILFIAFGLFSHFFLLSPVQSDPGTDRMVRNLQHENMDVRIEALRGLQTTLDPRLPEAFLIMLDDEGNSIRRLAARGIGSRYWQIPVDRVPAFVSKLKANRDAERYMRGRAIGLLTRKYEGEMFDQSPNGRWVLYERRSLPCLIDTTTGSEELLGWSPEREGSYSPPHIREGVKAYQVWHPEKEMAMMGITVHRRATTVWAWVHEKGLQKLDHSKFFKAVEINERHLISAAGFYLGCKGWNGDQAILVCDFMISNPPKKPQSGQEPTASDVYAEVLWNPVTDQVRKVSVKVDPQ